MNKQTVFDTMSKKHKPVFQYTPVRHNIITTWIFKSFWDLAYSPVGRRRDTLRWRKCQRASMLRFVVVLFQARCAFWLLWYLQQPLPLFLFATLNKPPQDTVTNCVILYFPLIYDLLEDVGIFCLLATLKWGIFATCHWQTPLRNFLYRFGIWRVEEKSGKVFALSSK